MAVSVVPGWHTYIYSNSLLLFPVMMCLALTSIGYYFIGKWTDKIDTINLISHLVLTLPVVIPSIPPFNYYNMQMENAHDIEARNRVILFLSVLFFIGQIFFIYHFIKLVLERRKQKKNPGPENDPESNELSKNRIEEIRAENHAYFDENAMVPGTEEISYSPDNKYYFKANAYLQSDPKRSWRVSKIEIYENGSNEKIFEFIRNYDTIFHGWLNVDDHCYLLLSEDLEGKSIYDLDNRKIYSYAVEDEQFIWASYYPSPDSKRLAIDGCYWACPSEIRIYDTSNPISYPYRQIFSADGNYKMEWIGNRTIKLIDDDGTSKIIEIE